MNPADKVPQIVKKVLDAGSERELSIAAYPEPVVETVIFHRLHFGMTAANALKSFRQLVMEFVDWNEIRVSTIQEIREQLKTGVNSLDSAVFIKDFLELVHRERQGVDMEFISELNLTETRRFLKQIRGIDQATIDLVLFRHKEHPVFPLSAPMEVVVQHAGLVKAQDTRDRKAKTLHDLVDPESMMTFHHFLIDLARELSIAMGEDDSSDDQLLTLLKSHKALMKSTCAEFLKKGRGGRTKTPAKAASKSPKDGSSKATPAKASAAKGAKKSKTSEQ